MNIRQENIPFLDLKRQYRSIREEVMKTVENVFENASFSIGQYVETFEKDFARYCNGKYAVGVNNGTSALHLAMLALGIGEGDEVIVPASTFIATAFGVSHTGATPVFADCKADTWQVDPGDVERKITKRTKAIVGVHLYGQPFEVDEIKSIAEKNNLFFVEDCAQAHGATYKGDKVGSFGDVSCFSFYPGKNLGAYGEAGAVVTDNEKIRDHVFSLRNQGSRQKYQHNEIGYNMRMEGVQAAILSLKLKYIDKWNERRKEIALRYQQEIKNPKIRMQFHPEWTQSVYHLFVVTTEKRNELSDFLATWNISCGIHYPVPCHLQNAYSLLNYKRGDLPNAEQLSGHCLSLPLFPEMTEEEVSYVIDVVNKY